MKSTIATIVMAASILTAQAPAEAGMAGLAAPQKSASTSEQLIHKTGRRGRRAAIIAGAVILGIAAAEASRRRSSRHYRRCRRWLDRCDRGYEAACWKYDSRCQN
ncbi:MAG: hypothetical protein ACR2OV_10215 [Hyphomicrobiaceae bacterium]